MFEWLWALVLQRIDRLLSGHLQYPDILSLLTMVGALMISFAWVMRKIGAKEVADDWDAQIKQSAELAKRKGWHQVSHWHARLGYSEKREPKSSSAGANGRSSTLSIVLFVGGVLLAVALLAFVTR